MDAKAISRKTINTTFLVTAIQMPTIESFTEQRCRDGLWSKPGWVHILALQLSNFQLQQVAYLLVPRFLYLKNSENNTVYLIAL